MLSAKEYQVLKTWGIESVSYSALPEGGTINTMVRLEAPQGTFFLRQARKDKTVQALQTELRVMRHAAQAGLPVVLPVKTLDGEAFAELDGSIFTLFPKAEGRQVARRDLGDVELQALGKMLARLTLALEDCPDTEVVRRSFSASTDETLAVLERLESHIRALPETKAEAVVLKHLASRRRYLQTEQPRLLTENLNVQVSHGDFHDENVFFGAEGVCAIIDWDQVRVVPRYFELLRTSHFLSERLEPRKVAVFVQAFLDAYPVDSTELAATVELYTAERAHNIWVFEAVYFGGNERVRAFLPNANHAFIPFEHTWQTVWKHVKT